MASNIRLNLMPMQMQPGLSRARVRSSGCIALVELLMN